MKDVCKVIERRTNSALLLIRHGAHRRGRRKNVSDIVTRDGGKDDAVTNRNSK